MITKKLNIEIESKILEDGNEDEKDYYYTILMYKQAIKSQEMYRNVRLTVLLIIFLVSSYVYGYYADQLFFFLLIIILIYELAFFGLKKASLCDSYLREEASVNMDNIRDGYKYINTIFR